MNVVDGCDVDNEGAGHPLPSHFAPAEQGHFYGSG